MPARISMVAWVCLRAWNGTGGSFLAVLTRDQSRLRLSGESSSPSRVVKTRVAGMRRPDDEAELELLTLWARSMATAPPQANIAPAPFRFRRLQPKAGFGLLDGSLDPERPASRSDRPIAARAVHPPHAGGKGKLDDWQQGVVGKLGADLRDLIGGENLNLPLFDPGGLTDRCHVAGEGAVLDG